MKYIIFTLLCTITMSLRASDTPTSMDVTAGDDSIWATPRFFFPYFLGDPEIPQDTASER